MGIPDRRLDTGWSNVLALRSSSSAKDVEECASSHVHQKAADQEVPGPDQAPEALRSLHQRLDGAALIGGKFQERPLLLERGEFLLDGADAFDARRRLRLELFDKGQSLA